MGQQVKHSQNFENEGVCSTDTLSSHTQVAIQAESGLSNEILGWDFSFELQSKHFYFDFRKDWIVFVYFLSNNLNFIYFYRMT